MKLSKVNDEQYRPDETFPLDNRTKVKEVKNRVYRGIVTIEKTLRTRFLVGVGVIEGRTEEKGVNRERYHEECWTI